MIFKLFLIILIVSSCSKIKKSNSTTSLSHIGSLQFSWEDQERKDDYYGGTRKVNVKIWYPSNKPQLNHKKSDYLLYFDELKNEISGWSPDDLKLLQAVQTSAYSEANLDENFSPYPLLVFSPSLGGNLSYYTYYAEHFVKKGYVVMGVNHLYESEAIVSDERVIPANLQLHNNLKSLKIPEQISAKKYREAKSQRMKVLAEDITFVMDEFFARTPIARFVDKEKIAIFGHSFGGGAVIYASLLDERIKAVIDLDGTPPTKATENGLNVPFLFIEDYTDYINHSGYAKLHKRRNAICERSTKDSWRVLIKDFKHNDFLDINYFLAANPSQAGTQQTNLNLVLKVMDGFLDQYLLNKKGFEFSPKQTERVEVFSFLK